jgi:NAD(P)-dependent dehydrogenase (short-subunit alcohol dehydrogenase family)
MSRRLKGKVAVVLGAGSSGPGWGNGKAAAVLFAREGAKVFAGDFRQRAAEETREIIAAEGGDATSFTTEVSKAQDIKSLVDACIKAYGRMLTWDGSSRSITPLRRCLISSIHSGCCHYWAS